MTGARAFWPGLFAAGATYQLLALRRRDGSHFSACVRDTFHTDTPEGKVALVVAWTALTAYVLPHWCKQVANVIEEIK